jgi:hypothetical protein
MTTCNGQSLANSPPTGLSFCALTRGPLRRTFYESTSNFQGPWANAAVHSQFINRPNLKYGCSSEQYLES